MLQWLTCLLCHTEAILSLICSTTTYLSDSGSSILCFPWFHKWIFWLLHPDVYKHWNQRANNTQEHHNLKNMYAHCNEEGNPRGAWWPRMCKCTILECDYLWEQQPNEISFVSMLCKNITTKTFNGPWSMTGIASTERMVRRKKEIDGEIEFFLNNWEYVYWKYFQIH